MSDPSFEAENASGGPVTSSPYWNFSGDAGIDNANPNTGTNDAFLGSGTLSQSLATTAGATYSISFYLAPDQATLGDALSVLLSIGGVDATVDVKFGTNDLTSPLIDALNGYFLSGATADVYLQWTYAAVANSNTTLLDFTGNNPDGTWYIDDVDVECTTNCTSGPTGVPEPGALTLFLAGIFAWLGFSCVRRNGRVA